MFSTDVAFKSVKIMVQEKNLLWYLAVFGAQLKLCLEGGQNSYRLPWLQGFVFAVVDSAEENPGAQLTKI